MKNFISKLISLIRKLILLVIPIRMKEDMLSCEEVAFIIANNEKRSSYQAVKLYMHLFVCRDCQHTKQQITNIRDLTEHIDFDVSYIDEKSNKTQDDLITKFSKKNR